MHPANVTPFPCAPNLNPSAPCCCPLRSRLLLLLLPQRRQTNTRDLDDLESNTGNITLRLTLTTESSEQDLVVLVYEVETTIVGNYISLAIVLIIPSHPQLPKFPIHSYNPGEIFVPNSPKAVTFFPFLINCTRTHFRIAELGCLASTPTFSRTIPLA
jgi:hypothetical protein